MDEPALVLKKLFNFEWKCNHQIRSQTFFCSFIHTTGFYNNLRHLFTWFSSSTYTSYLDTYLKFNIWYYVVSVVLRLNLLYHQQQTCSSLDCDAGSVEGMPLQLMLFGSDLRIGWAARSKCYWKFTSQMQASLTVMTCWILFSHQPNGEEDKRRMVKGLMSWE